ncbi:MAG TPA: hypothetical protein VGO93_07840, partial [Candidatus Xenobia bacterium]
MFPVLECLVDRSAEATALDRELRFLMTADTRVQRAIGAILLRLQRSELTHLGYVQRGDYIREHTGISIRQAEQLAAIERDVVQFPASEAQWSANQINTCLREIIRSAKPEDDGVCAALATVMTVRELIIWLVGEQAAEPGEETLDLHLSARGTRRPRRVSRTREPALGAQHYPGGGARYMHGRAAGSRRPA